MQPIVLRDESYQQTLGVQAAVNRLSLAHRQTRVAPDHGYLITN
jgi:hypothetical protein